MTDEGRPSIPPGYSAPLDPRPSRLLIDERIAKLAAAKTASEHLDLDVLIQLGSIVVAPRPPQVAHRNAARRRLDEASAPHRMIQGASAVGTPRPHLLQ